MSDNRATIRATISADATQFNTAMGKAVSRARAAGAAISKGIGGAVVAVAKLAAKAVAAGVALAGVAVSAALFKGSKLAAEMESTTIAFETLVGSASLARDVLEQLKVLGAETPYAFSDFTEAAKLMKSFGIATEDIVPMIKMLGDISSGSAEKLQSLSLVMGQVASAGRLNGGDLLQFINAGFNPLNDIAKKTGETMLELRKRMSDGGISFNEVKDAMKAATSEGGLFFQMMEKQSKSFSGRMSTLKVSVDTILTRLMAPINSALLPYLEKATKVIEDMTPKVEAVAERFAQGFSVDKIGPTFMMLSDFIAAALIEGISKGVQFGIAILGAAFSPDGLKFIGDALYSVFLDAFVAIVNQSEQMAKNIASFFTGEKSEVVSESKAVAKTFAEIINEAMKGIDFAPSEAMDKATDKLKKAFADLYPEVAPKVVTDDYDAELKEQKERVAADNAAREASKPTKYEEFGPSSSLANQALLTAVKRQKDSAASGFGGLAGFYSMQADRERGGGIGESSVFNRDRKDMGLSSGLTTGGLGEKRRLATSKDNRDEKKRLELEKTSTDHLKDISTNIKESLTVK